VKFNFTNGQLLTLSPGKRRGTFYCHSIQIWQAHKTKAPSTRQKVVLKSPGTQSLALRHKALVVVQLFATLLSVSTQGTLGRLATSGGTGRSSNIASPARGSDIPADQFQLVAGKNGAKNAGLMMLQHMVQ